MNLKPFERYPWSALVLLGCAILILIVTLFTNRGDITSATLVLVSFACFFGGLFVIGFQKVNPVSPEIAGILPVHGSIGFARICADLGIQGDAHIMPAGSSFPAGLVQFNPVAEFRPVAITGDYTFCSDGDGKGVVSVPAGWYLLVTLRDEYALRIPGDEEGILEAIREAGEDILEIADRVEVRRSGDDIVVELQNFHLSRGCRMVRQESPKCCTLAPCPVCSLMACILSRGTGATVTIRNVISDPDTDSITLVLSTIR